MFPRFPSGRTLLVTTSNMCPECHENTAIVARCSKTGKFHLNMNGKKKITTTTTLKTQPQSKVVAVVAAPPSSQTSSPVVPFSTIRHVVSKETLEEMKHDRHPTQTEYTMQAIGSLLQSLYVQGMLFTYMGCPTPFPSPFLVAASAVIVPVALDAYAPDGFDSVFREQHLLLLLQQKKEAGVEEISDEKTAVLAIL
eukprot:PhF_6_TR26585/c0_g1_i1/m.38468